MKVYFSPGFSRKSMLINLPDKCPDCEADLTAKEALEATYYVRAIVEGDLDKDGKFKPTNYIEGGTPPADEGLGYAPFSYRCAACGLDLMADDDG